MSGWAQDALRPSSSSACRARRAARRRNRRTAATQQAIESAWKGIVTFSPTAAKLTGKDVVPGIAWGYTIEIQGQLTLRYPKDAAGQAIALTGEFTGNATKFKSWDNLPVRFPAARGALFKTVRIEPLTVDDITSLSDLPLTGLKISGQPKVNPLATTLDKGGPVVKGTLAPAFFRILVRGDLSGESLRLELGEAVMDFSDKSVFVTTVLFSVLSLRPHVVSYSLPYADGRWILGRAMDVNAGPVEFTVVKGKEQMTLVRTFARTLPASHTSAEYRLDVKACNPAC